PEELYANGLQRESFVPAIRLLQQHCNVLQIEPGLDYRLRQLEEATLYYYPLTAGTDTTLRQRFIDIAPDPNHIEENPRIEILGRHIPARMCADDVVWFEFDQLCRGPRSAFDYVEIARLFHAVFVSGLPALDDSDLDATRRLVNLVDEFYDRRVKLIIAAEVALETIYQGQTMGFEFERTRSRLLEMQSRDYLAQEHRA
ncbi:MAG: cell division protein ZapE, partial [Gammaproteobacteria bacterium]